jgi:hypothetical protein
MSAEIEDTTHVCDLGWKWLGKTRLDEVFGKDFVDIAVAEPCPLPYECKTRYWVSRDEDSYGESHTIDECFELFSLPYGGIQTFELTASFVTNVEARASNFGETRLADVQPSRSMRALREASHSLAIRSTQPSSHRRSLRRRIEPPG